MRLPRSVGRWGDIVARTGRAIYEDDCLGWAGELASFWFLALFPALLFAVAFASLLPAQYLVDAAVRGLARVAPLEVLSLVREQLVQIAQGPPRGLLVLSLLGAVWSSSSAMTAIIETLNQAYHVRERRSWWRVRLVAIGLTVVLTAFGLISVGFMMAGPTLARFVEDSLGVPSRSALLWAVAERPIVFGLTATALGCVYYFAPDMRPRRGWVTPGSIAATLLWMIASLGLDWYADHFGDYQKTYGAIGAELNAAIEDAAAGSQAPRQPDCTPAPPSAGVRRMRRTPGHRFTALPIFSIAATVFRWSWPTASSTLPPASSSWPSAFSFLLPVTSPTACLTRPFA